MTRPAVRTYTTFALAALLAASAGSAFLEIGGDLQDRFLPEDPAVESLAVEQQRFGDAAALIILAEWSHPIEVEALVARTESWTKDLELLEGVEAVESFLSAPTLRWKNRNEIEMLPLRNLNSVARRDQAEGWGRALREPLVRKLFLRPDGLGTALFVRPNPAYARDARKRARLWKALSAWTSAPHEEDVQFTTAGALAFTMQATEVAIGDVWRVSLPLLLAVFGLLGWGLGSMPVGAVAVLAALPAPMAAIGCAGYASIVLSQFSLIVVALIFTVALLDNVHLAWAWQQARAAGTSPTDATQEARTDCLRPCLWTTVTTVAGFSVLLSSSVPQIRQFGGLAAAGAAWALVGSWYLLPRLLEALTNAATARGFADSPPPGSSHAAPSSGAGPGILLRITQRAGSLPTGSVLGASLALVLVCLPGLGRLRIEADFPRLFGPQHPVTTQLEGIEQRWGGIATVSFLLRPLVADVEHTTTIPSSRAHFENKVTARLDAEQLELLNGLVRLLEARELVTGVISPLDLLGTGERDFRRRFNQAPDTENIAAAIESWRSTALSVEGGAARWLQADEDGIRVTARVRMMQPERFPALAADLEGIAHDLSGRFDVQLSGWPLVYKNLEARLLEELVSSFTLAFLVVGVLLALALGSPRWWLLALGPNLAPLLIVLGALGWSDAGFSSGLLLAPGIALGLVVDDTIHFALRAKRALQQPASEEPAGAAANEDSLERALRQGGTPITLTTLVLITGFAALGLSRFTGNQTLAAVMMAVAALAWVGDVIVFPALLRKMKMGSGPITP